MRKLFCLIIVCILASVFVISIRCFSVTKRKILRTQWFGSGMMKMYSPPSFPRAIKANAPYTFNTTIKSLLKVLRTSQSLDEHEFESCPHDSLQKFRIRFVRLTRKR